MENETNKVDNQVPEQKLEQNQTSPAEVRIDPKLQEQMNSYAKQIQDLQTQLSSEKLSKQKESEQRKIETLKQEADIKRLLLGDEPKKKVSPDDVDSLRPSEILELVSDAFDKSFEARKTQATMEVEERINGLSKHIEDMKAVLLQQMAEKSVSSVRSTYKDFDSHKEDVLKIINEVPGIDVKDAYLLAKARKMTNQPPVNETSSERPDNPSAQSVKTAPRPPRRERDAEHDGSARSRSAFRDILGSAIEKVISTRSYPE